MSYAESCVIMRKQGCRHRQPHMQTLHFVYAIDLQLVYFVQLSLGEVLSLAAAVETCSEHPLAGAVLQFAAAHLAAPVASLDADLTAGLNQLEEPSEASQLLPSPTKAQRHSSPTVTATDWLQPATDVEVEEGEVDIACGLPYRLA